jgi:phosphate transport system substrate-binding protein
MIVHATNPIDAMSDAQIVDIFKGRINRWSRIGGPAREITVVNKAAGRSTLELFLKHFQIKNTDVDADVIIGDNEQGIKTVAGNPNAISYVSIGAAEYSAKHGVSIRLMPVGGVEPSVENVRNGLFPLSRPLTLVTAAEPQGLAADFIRFARSAQADKIVRSQHFVPLSKPEGSVVAK